MNLPHTAGFVILFMLLDSPLVPGQDVKTETQPASTAPDGAGQVAKPSAGRESAAKRFALDIWTDQKAIWTSPFRMNRRQLLTVAVPVTAVTGGLIATDAETARWLPNTPSQIQWSKGVSTFGSVYSLGGIVAGGLIVGKAGSKPTLFRMGRTSAEALVNTVIVSSVLKLATGRERPDEGDGRGRFWKGGHSFPSGHSMNSWAVALAVARTPGCPRWLAITSYAVATAVSISRYTAHRHFPSDVFVGSTFGILIGKYVATRPRP